MESYSDPLALAVAVITTAMNEEAVDYGTDRLEASIWRLLTGAGWMVSFKRVHLFFDYDVEKIAS